jgi:hypothetical protein
VEILHGVGNFQPYVARLQNGPIDMDPKIGAELVKRLSALPVPPT